MSKAGERLIAAAKEVRRSIRAGELDEAIAESVRQSKMDARHDHLNELLNTLER